MDLSILIIDPRELRLDLALQSLLRVQQLLQLLLLPMDERQILSVPTLVPFALLLSQLKASLEILFT